MLLLTNLAEHLAPLVGAEFVAERNGVFVVSPKDTQEVAAVMGFADQHGLKVRPTGGRTKLSWGSLAEVQIELSLLRLNQVVDHPWQDLTCTVQAGCTWETLQQTLARHGQFVALDPLWPSTATVGGVCATNDSGALRHRYGSLRDMVLGMTIVLADGTIARTGGRVVKNVAGYDVPKLMVGSLGTLAIITEVTFRLYALPRHQQDFLVTAESSEKLSPLMRAIRESHLATQALQLHGNVSFLETVNGSALYIELNAHPEALQNEMLDQMCLREGLTLGFLGSAIPFNREALFRPDAVVIRGTMLPQYVAAFADYVQREGGASVIQSFGVMYANFPYQERNGVPVLRVVKDLWIDLQAAGGSLTVLHVPDALAAEYAAWPARMDTSSSTPKTGEAVLLANAIKQQFDPNQTLNPLANESAAQPVR
ncbi:FAD-binding oxidoreductase [Terriglobus albidus]|uniref:FAD-binding oxidoreductase n=1 Tax=Terriglobus albidus TaxID=1592106 RepID=A0A5B9EE40_9BACT|nr:FAD-binding oxidoreductase [Terriglobus albidus]QEE30019.1 FAD-binding oxidoreductase [Terriglobus albidus]